MAVFQLKANEPKIRETIKKVGEDGEEARQSAYIVLRRFKKCRDDYIEGSYDELIALVNCLYKILAFYKPALLELLDPSSLEETVTVRDDILRSFLKAIPENLHPNLSMKIRRSRIKDTLSHSRLLVTRAYDPKRTVLTSLVNLLVRGKREIEEVAIPIVLKLLEVMVP